MESLPRKKRIFTYFFVLRVVDLLEKARKFNVTIRGFIGIELRRTLVILEGEINQYSKKYAEEEI